MSSQSFTSAPAIVLLVLTLITLSSSSVIDTVSRRRGCRRCFRTKICVGPPGNKKCVTPMDIGQSCGRDPFWVCKSGLSCENFICRGRFIPEGGRCTATGLPCRVGLKCAGRPGLLKCVKPMREGKPCLIDPWWVCADGLVCRGNVCQQDRIPKGRSCRFPGAICGDGLVCAGPPENPRCVMPMLEGGQCRGGRDPYWVCAEGLQCINNICRRVRATTGGRCDGEGDVCEDGMVCAGPPEKPRCVKPMGPGGKCGVDPFWVCIVGLTCVDGICE